MKAELFVSGLVKEILKVQLFVSDLMKEILKVQPSVSDLLMMKVLNQLKERAMD